MRIYAVGAVFPEHITAAEKVFVFMQQYGIAEKQSLYGFKLIEGVYYLRCSFLRYIKLHL